MTVKSVLGHTLGTSFLALAPKGTAMNASNPKFDLRGINHLALVCSDMRRTIDFYSGVLGMPLVKTLDLPDGLGQHFFFDCGGGNTVAFFWLADSPTPHPVSPRPRAARTRVNSPAPSDP